MGVIKKDEELSPELRRVAKAKGTETLFTGEYWDSYKEGVYKCAICDTELFSSEAKFDSGTGWPSFTDPISLEHIKLKEDVSGGVVRTEVLCKNCGAHLVHVFDDLPKNKEGKRYCINSICLTRQKS